MEIGDDWYFRIRYFIAGNSLRVVAHFVPYFASQWVREEISLADHSTFWKDNT